MAEETWRFVAPRVSRFAIAAVRALLAGVLALGMGRW